MTDKYKAYNISTGLDDAVFAVVQNGAEMNQQNAQSMADKLNQHDKLVEENQRLRARIEELESNLFFVGYTNPAQLVHVCDDVEPSGSYYPTTDSETTIPLFMLKSHEMRLMALTNDELTLDELSRLQNEGLFKK